MAQAVQRTTDDQDGSLTWELNGVHVAGLTREEALDVLIGALAQRRATKLAFCNAHLVNAVRHDPALRHALEDFLVLPDGIGVDIGALILHGRFFPANLNGTDFIPALLARAETPLTVMLLGGRPGIAERAAERMRKVYPCHEVEVLHHGYYAPEEEAGLLRRLRERRPDLLLVAFGCPDQELWIARHVDERCCTIAAGVGALLDFQAGRVKRSPRWMRGARIEWTYRLALEPRRLWRRYLIGNGTFLAAVVAAKLRMRPGA